MARIIILSVGQIILKHNNERTAVNSHCVEITCFGLETNIDDIFKPYHYVILRLICGMNPGALPSGSTPLSGGTLVYWRKEKLPMVLGQFYAVWPTLNLDHVSNPVATLALW